MTADYSILPVGDAALLVAFADRLDAAINARVVWLAEELRRTSPPGVRDIVPAYRSLAVYFDPLRTDGDKLIGLLEVSAAASRDARIVAAPVRQVPVCYGGSFGPDLEEMVTATGLTEAEIIARHSAPTYRVFMIGFSPGFAYMGPVDPTIAVARRATPRVRVAAGSVGIAGQQTGIYPSATPGGWMLVGRTPVQPFQPTRHEPFLFKAGDAVQFVPIGADDYRRLTSSGRER